MIEWYYHQQPQGRVGPLSAEQMRARFESGHLRWDSLAWREGMAEWQPLTQVGGEIGLVPPAAPPPLPPDRPANAPRRADDLPAPSPAPSPAPRAREFATTPAPAPRRGLGGCAIAAIVLAVVAVPMLGILAAIALPTYQDYTVRAKVAAALAEVPALKAAVLDHRQRTGACAQEASGSGAPTPRAADGTALETVRFGRLPDGRCAFELTLGGIGPQADGLTVLYAAPAPDAGERWDCSGGTLPARYRPGPCRPAPR